MKNILNVENLQKSYNGKKVLKGINFDVKKGEILGLLGPNGAGKSTTINILSTILKADDGKVNILGFDINKEAMKVKNGIGIVPQDLAIYEEISAEKNVRFFAQLYDLKSNELDKQVKKALELVGLYDRKDDKPKTFSGGMKRRLNIACAISHNPKLIIMDEPTVGIDPQSRNHILESIKKLNKDGATVIYSTHYMEEVEEIANRIIVMNEGNIIAEGTKESLTKEVSDNVIYFFNVKKVNETISNKLSDINGVEKVKVNKDKIEVTAKKSKVNFNKLISVLVENGCEIESMTSKEASLETVFLELTGRNLRD